jgi:PAS domain S-box-containing protein
MPSTFHDVFPGASVMATAMRAKDWQATAMGDPAAWPHALKVPLRMMLTSRFEMWLGWGPDLAFFYNDAYVPTLGTKHPTALGQPMREVWKEVFDAVSDRITSVMRDGIATWDQALLLFLERNGYPEETYHTFSYSPLRGDSGTKTEGLMCVVTEVTEQVIADRRLETLRTLATSLLAARTHDDILLGAETALSRNRRDFPFALVRLFEAGADLTDRDIGPAATPVAARWPLKTIVDGATHQLVPLSAYLADPPRGAWTIPPCDALVVPIFKTGQTSPSGALVVGLNPYRPKDSDILGFAQLLASQIAGVLASVDARLAEIAEVDRLRQLFAQSPSFIAVLRGPEHRFEMTNPGYQRLIGHRDVIGKTVREALPEIDGQGFFEFLDSVYAKGEPVTGQSAQVTILRAPDGVPEPRYVDFVYQPIRDTGGLVTGIFVEGIDVTDAHNSAAALLASEAQFRTFSQAIPNHFWTSLPDGNLDWFNDQTLIYCGRSAESLMGNRWADIVHPDDLARAAEAWAHSLATGEDYEIEFRILRADGAYLWHLVRALPLRDEHGTITRWIGTNTDIHARKLAEASNAAERDRIWASTNDLMGTAGTDGFLKTVNPAWHRLLGYDEATLLSKPFSEIIEPLDHAKVTEAVGRLARGLAVDDLENRLIHADGTTSVIAWSAEPFGDFFHMVGRNVTQQRLAEDALRQAQKMEAVGQLTGGIAHDFNNLLQGITGSLELVQKRITQGRTNELDRFISGAMTAANRAAALTHRLLAFSRRQPLDPRPVKANPLVASMEDLLRRTLGERIELELVLAGGLWLTLCDPNQLESALLNLAINARDAMPDGGKLIIETCNAHLDNIYVARQRDVRAGQYVCICVTDTGTGMTAETMARAFEPFYTTKPIGQGTGLGLSMIYGFARQSEGYAKIYSEVGKGTSFKLYLPRFRGEADDDETVSEAVKPGDADVGETVLVVEDEPVVRGLVIELLTDLGYRVLEASDGPKGLEMLQSKRHIDLLVTDIGLPGMNGRQVADAGRVLRPGLKVLFMTGYAENAALASGFLDHGMAMITKPFAMNVFGTRVREMLEGA